MNSQELLQVLLQSCSSDNLPFESKNTVRKKDENPISKQAPNAIQKKGRKAKTIDAEGQQFQGIFKRSKRGGQTIVYRIGEKECYDFTRQRVNTNFSIYACSGCKVAKKHLTVRVIGDKFLADPAQLGHFCTPMNYHKLMAQGEGYRAVQDIKANMLGYVRPSEAIQETIRGIGEKVKGADAEEITKYFGKAEKHRSAFSRAINSNRKAIQFDSIITDLLDEPNDESVDNLNASGNLQESVE